MSDQIRQTEMKSCLNVSRLEVENQYRLCESPHQQTVMSPIKVIKTVSGLVFAIPVSQFSKRCLNSLSGCLVRCLATSTRHHQVSGDQPINYHKYPLSLGRVRIPCKLSNDTDPMRRFSLKVNCFVFISF